MEIYQEAHIQKVEEQLEIINYTAWINGQYNMASIGAAMSKKSKYPDKPMELTKKEETSISGEERFVMWIDEYNRRFDED